MKYSVFFLAVTILQFFTSNVGMAQGQEIVLHIQGNQFNILDMNAVDATLFRPAEVVIYTNQATPQTCNTNAECDDGIGCTTDICNLGVCQNIPNNAVCSDGQFCTGVELCIPSLGCVFGTPPCTECQICNESIDQCVNLPDGTSCSNGGNCENGICQSALPVELISFDIKVDNSKVYLFWRTASEIQNLYFLVQHSVDGFAFKDIAQISGAGNSQIENDYEYLHSSPSLGWNYYRLKQVDRSGVEIHSKILTVEVHGVSPIVFPNPNDGNFSVLLQNFKNKAIKVIVSDLSGRVISESSFLEGMDVIDLKFNVQSGIYFIRLESGDAVWWERVVIR